MLGERVSDILTAETENKGETSDVEKSLREIFFLPRISDFTLSFWSAIEVTG